MYALILPIVALRKLEAFVQMEIYGICTYLQVLIINGFQIIHFCALLIFHFFYGCTKNLISICHSIHCWQSISIWRIGLFLTMKTTHYRAVIKFFDFEGLLTTGIHTRMARVLKYLLFFPTVHRVHRWVSEFKRGRINLEDEPLRGSSAAYHE